MAFRQPITRISQLIADALIGATIATAASGARWVLSTGFNSNTMQGYTGDVHETVPAQVITEVNGSALQFRIMSPFYTGMSNAILALQAFATGTAAILQADTFTVNDHNGQEYLYADATTVRVKAKATFTNGIKSVGRFLGEDVRTVAGGSQASGSPANQGTLTLPLVAGNRYRAVWVGNVNPGTAGQYFNVDLKHGVGAATGGNFFQRTFWDCRAAGRIVTATVVGEFVAPTTQTENVVAVMTPQGGTGATYTDGTAGAPSSMFYVEEIPA